ncbi:MAG: serine/threonine protein kinase [Betaproteobacteria bacterium HGW-Betaproteobacteria-3]|jgi:serine/threonine protein kinase|nr:MAG: serine/threonine protein kinase [Betaproteobacteria bacterium HGW-Betaproteobacteria-3]
MPLVADATLGRFQLREPLGRGAQGVVWLAFDPKLAREVAVKQMHAGARDAAAAQRWLAEARAVSRLSHPNIVTLFEAELAANPPFLVFERVRGQSLTDLLRTQGALPAATAVPLMMGVLQGLAHAHAAGVIHRDLKPANIIVDAEGRARIMDFGLAEMANAPGSVPGLSGTAAYMAPEAGRGEPPAASMDIFSAALVLFEMLSGRPAMAEADAQRAIQRLANEDLVLPADTLHPVDDELRAIVQRAMARDPTMRPASANEFHQALSGWLAPAGGADASAAGAGHNSTLEFLLRRMRHKSDFPALSDSVVRIQRLAQSETESVGSLSNEILKDVALTNKLLRLVNSTFYARAGSGTINTISRAVALVGYAGIRNLALSLVLLEHMHDKQQAVALREEFLRALAAGTLARELSPTAQGAEEAFISAVFQNLGRMLTHFYFPEEARQIQSRLAGPGGAAGSDPEEAESRAILGIGFQDLATGVARHWGLPDTLIQAMRRLPTDRPAPEQDPLRAAACAGNDVADALMTADSAEGERRLRAVSQRYGRALGLTSARVRESVERTRRHMLELSQVLQVVPRPGSAAARLVGAPEAPAAAKPEANSLAQFHLDKAVAAAAPGESDNGAEGSVAAAPSAMASATFAAEQLAAGIQDISNTLVENFSLNEVLRMVLETMYRSLGFQRVVFCMRDARTGMLTGRVALGEGADAIAPRFQIDMAAADLFSTVCKRGADMLIADASVANIRRRLPTWFVSSVNAPTFLLLPLAMNGNPLGVIYADAALTGGIVVAERELSLLRTLRNQAIMAFKHAGRPG